MRGYKRLSGVAIMLLLLVVAGPAIAADREQGVLSVTGNAVEYFKPDTLLLRLSVETLAVGAAEAVAENAAKAEMVVSTLKALISKDKGDSIRTSGFNVMPDYRHDGNMTRITGFKAVHTVSVRTGRTEAAGEIIDRAIKSGANRVESVNFTLADIDKHCDRALEKAAREAEVKARKTAGLFDMRVSGIRDINTNCGGAMPMFYAIDGIAERESSEPATALESGDVPVSAYVNVTYRIE